MSKVNYSNLLAKEYEFLYKSCKVNENSFEAVDRVVDKILSNKTRYEDVAFSLSIPWYIVAAIHNMQSSQNFSRHLHNGDPRNTV